MQCGLSRAWLPTSSVRSISLPAPCSLPLGPARGQPRLLEAAPAGPAPATPRRQRAPPGLAASASPAASGSRANAVGMSSVGSPALEAAADGGVTAVVLVDHGSRRAESNANLDEFVKVFQAETGHQLVEPAHMELARPTIAEAFSKCVERGATFVIVCPYFLAPGRHWSQDIPALCAEAAKSHPGVKYMVTAPIGAHPLVAHILDERIQHCLQRNQQATEPCAACQGKESACKIQSNSQAEEEALV